MSKHETLAGDSEGVARGGGLLLVSDVQNAVHSVISECSCCGKKCIGVLCETCNFDVDRGGYPVFDKGDKQSDYFFDTPVLLDKKYTQSHDILGQQKVENAEVYQLGYEIYEGIRVLILEVHRRKLWIHKGRKMIDGKPSEIETLTPKTSDKTENIRIEFNPNNLVEGEIVVYGGKKRNGNIIPVQEVDYSQLLGFVREANFGEN